MLKYSVKHSIKNNLQDKLTPVRVRISFNSLRPEIYSGVLVKPSEFNSNKVSAEQKRKLNRISAIIDDIFLHFEANEKRFPTVEELKNEFAVKTDKSKPIDDNPLLQDVFKEFMNNQSQIKQWKSGRIKSYEAILHHIYMYDKNLRVNSISENTLLGMIRYFQTAPKNYRTGKKMLPHRNTTVEKNIYDFLSVLKWAAKKKIYKGDLHDTFAPTFKGTSGELKEVVYLEWNELLEMFNKDFGSERLNHVRDVFAFCCFTGQRFSDVKSLQHSDIRDGYFLNTTEKTIEPLRIDLNDYSAEILSRYKNFLQPLPIISHDKTNQYIKEIAEIMEWNTPVSEVYFVGEKRHDVTYMKKDVLSTHAGRRTFVVNALKMNIPSIVVRSWTGHKDERAMKPYTKIVDELKSEQMKKFNRTPENTTENSDT